MSDHNTAHLYPNPDWIVAAPGMESGANPADLAAESVEQKIERLRSSEPDEWARIEGLGPSEEEMAELRVSPPRELFEENWRTQ